MTVTREMILAELEGRALTKNRVLSEVRRHHGVSEFHAWRLFQDMLGGGEIREQITGSGSRIYFLPGQPPKRRDDVVVHATRGRIRRSVEG